MGLESMGVGGPYQARIITYLGEAHLLAGHPEQALAFAKRAMTFTRERGHRGQEAWAAWLLGEIASYPLPPDTETAQDRYREALALANELGMRPLVAHCHLGLGKLYRRTGKREQAREQLTVATSMYRDMNMRFWLEQEEAERAI